MTTGNSKVTRRRVASSACLSEALRQELHSQYS